MTVQSVRTQFITDYSNRGAVAFQRDLNTLGGRVDKVATQASQSFGRFARFSQAAGTALMVGVGAALAVGIKASIDFEDAFAGVRKTVDASEPEFERLGRAIRDLALEIPITANELAKIGELGGQLGIPVEALDTFIETIAKLGVATNLSTEDAATGIARLGNVMGTSFNDFENLGSSLVDLGNNFATTESEILAFGTRLAGIGSTIGLTEGEVLGLSAAFTALGEPAERGATAVQRAFVSMFQAVSQAGSDLETFAVVSNMAAEEFAALFREDPAQAFIAFARGLNEVVEAGRDVTSILQDLGLGSQRTLGAMLKAAQGVDMIEGAMTRGNEAFAENVALSDEAAERFGTMQSQIGLLRNSFTELRMEVGDRATPAFKDLLGFGGAWFRLVGDNLGLLEKLFTLVALFAGAKGLLAVTRALHGAITAFSDTSVVLGEVVQRGSAARIMFGRLSGGIRVFGGVIGAAALALTVLSVAFAKNRQHAENYARAVENTLDVLEAFAEGTANASDVYEAFTLQLSEKTGIFDMSLDLDDFRDFVSGFGFTTRQLVDWAIHDFDKFERETSRITRQLSENVEGWDGGLAGREERVRRLNTWLRIINEITEGTAALREQEELRNKERAIETREITTATGGPGAIGLGGPTDAFMEGITAVPRSSEITRTMADIAGGIINSREEYNEALNAMLDDTRDFTMDFSDEWNEIVADFNDSLFDWSTAWNEYERVTGVSTADMTRSIDNFLADQRARTAALAFVYDEFGEEVGELFAALPLDIQMSMGAILENSGPDAFSAQVDKFVESWGESLSLAMENAIIMAPSGARAAFEEWVGVFDELVAGMGEEAIVGSQEWIDAVMASFTQFRLDLADEQPHLVSAFDDLITAAIEELDDSRPWMDLEEVTRGMTTPEKLDHFRMMGLDWVQAIMLAWGTLPDQMGAVAGRAARSVDRTFGGGIRADSPSKLFMEYGKFAAQGFEMGFNASLAHMSFKPNQPVLKLEAPAQAPNGPSITIVNPQHKDDDILDGLQRATTLTGLTRMAEVTRN